MATKHERIAETQSLALLRQTLNPKDHKQTPSLKGAADAAGISVRTLQRQLSAQGLSYSHLLKEARFEAAVALLGDPAKRVTDIAYELGYTDVAHFSRAFRRIAGMPPREYRRRLSDR
jgi:AraC-like DNA-binding protein